MNNHLRDGEHALWWDDREVAGAKDNLEPTVMQFSFRVTQRSRQRRDEAGKTVSGREDPAVGDRRAAAEIKRNLSLF